MIRLIDELDYDEIKNIYKDIFNINENLSDPFSIKKVYIDDEKIIGLIDYSIIYERAELNYIYVIDDYKRRGIATLLMDNMFLTLKDKNINSITLEVRIDNISAINLYQKLGFKIITKREKYYDGIDAYLMQKEW